MFNCLFKKKKKEEVKLPQRGKRERRVKQKYQAELLLCVSTSIIVRYKHTGHATRRKITPASVLHIISTSCSLSLSLWKWAESEHPLNLVGSSHAYFVCGHVATSLRFHLKEEHRSKAASIPVSFPSGRSRLYNREVNPSSRS